MHTTENWNLLFVSMPFFEKDSILYNKNCSKACIKLVTHHTTPHHTTPHHTTPHHTTPHHTTPQHHITHHTTPHHTTPHHITSHTHNILSRESRKSCAGSCSQRCSPASPTRPVLYPHNHGNLVKDARKRSRGWIQKQMFGDDRVIHGRGGERDVGESEGGEAVEAVLGRRVEDVAQHCHQVLVSQATSEVDNAQHYCYLHR